MIGRFVTGKSPAKTGLGQQKFCESTRVPSPGTFEPLSCLLTPRRTSLSRCTPTNSHVSSSKGGPYGLSQTPGKIGLPRELALISTIIFLLYRIMFADPTTKQASEPALRHRLCPCIKLSSLTLRDVDDLFAASLSWSELVS